LQTQGGDGFLADYNLILLQSGKSQHISDFVVLRNMLFGTATDIEVHVVASDVNFPEGFWPHVAKCPTLIFSPAYPAVKRIPDTARGTRLVAVNMSKGEEVRALSKAGLPVPETTLLQPWTEFDEAAWGLFTILKPNVGFQGRGIRLVRTRDVKWRHSSSWPKDDWRHGKNILAQRFINPGPYPRSHRVFTVLGHAIYSIVSIATEKIDLPDPSGDEPVDLEVAANGVARRIEMCFEEDVIALAETVHRKLSHLPTMGIDIVREHETGRLFVLELNSGGFTWHLSSDYGLNHQRTHGLDLYGQFNALGTIAKALIETTRESAT
jgi:hypothetical protein